MIFTRLALAAFAFLSFIKASDGASYNYDSSSSIGPDQWASLAIDSNQCGGSKQSPIAVETTACNTYADYTLTVSFMKTTDWIYECA
jgi:carbonic anhydrase